jgi:pimeloyl-ACP methyl ester carboxylesterase
VSIVQANGLAVHVQELEPDGPPAGDGPAPTAVLIHGTATDSLASWYLTLAQPLAEAGMRVVMYDLRGHGRSERPPHGYRLDDFVDDLAALIDVLGIAGPVHLLGNSLGGTIAFGYAVRHPDLVASIVAVESSPPTAEWMRRIAWRMARAADYLPTEHALAEIGASRGESAARRAEGVRQLLATTTLGQDLPASAVPSAAQLAAVACPVLCLYGGDSAVAELAPEVELLLPHARTVVVPGQRHALLVTAPEKVRQAVLPWLPISLTTP